MVSTMQQPTEKPPFIQGESQPSFSRDESSGFDEDGNNSIGYSDDKSVYSEGWGAHNATDEAANDDGDNGIAKAETRGVVRLRIIVALVLICSTLAVALFTCTYIRTSEQTKFEEQFTGDSGKVLDAIGASFDKTFGLLDSLTVSMVSHARYANESWPFVTLPDFALHVIKLLPITNALYISVYPAVTMAQRAKWEAYSVTHDSWVNESMKLQEDWDGYYGSIGYGGNQTGVIYGNEGPIPRDENRTFLPFWQTFPVTASTSYNWDYITLEDGKPLESVCLKQQKAALLSPCLVPDEDDPEEILIADEYAEFLENFIPEDAVAYEPAGDIVYPIIDVVNKLASNRALETEKKKDAVGVVAAAFYWRDMIRNILPMGSDGIQIVFENPCTQPFTYQINGPEVKFLGIGDHHDPAFDYLHVHKLLSDLQKGTARSSAYTGVPLDDEYCQMMFHVYPSNYMKDRYISNNSIIFTVAVVLVFVFTSLVFYLYDLTVERRQRTVMKTAVRSTAIVSSLFPSTVRDQIYPQQDELPSSKINQTEKGSPKLLLNTGAKVGDPARSGPIANLYPETTVLFADIAGFTAWSSERQPTQVFHLLESIFGAFDEIAKKRGIFKVETIGDCYVAVVGLPTPRKHHAVAMARFAVDCRDRVNVLMQELDKILGPGTADLAMRFGLNSGPTTAGVLRGEKTRFQLFGDTVNTAARMESNGEANKIQVSQKTADLIKLAGKGHWLTERSEKVDCKGKGMMTTYWCNPNAGGASTAVTSTSSATEDEDIESDIAAAESQRSRLVDWNVDMFGGLLKDVVNHRLSITSHGSVRNLGLLVDADDGIVLGKPLDEVTEVLPLAKRSCCGSQRNPNSTSTEIEISAAASAQLRQYIESISTLYPSNPFHNFAHCSHVAMSTKKLLDRVTEDVSNTKTISLDPLTRFAIVFSALIHDVDHPGVSNSQLINEGDAMATTYDGKSVAEQNSVDLAWRLLQNSEYDELRKCIYTTSSERQQFRQVVVNCVMATDLFDKDLLALRATRWEKSFNSSDDASPCKSWKCCDVYSNRRATIVIELIMQASDVSHTMQHFTVYQKWNHNLLLEMYHAYCNGRMATNPLDKWYEGELWFFDNYVIPLAKKLKECGVFGVSCDEFLDYAMDNRMEWELKGREIVRSFADNCGVEAEPMETVVSTFEL